MTMRRRSFLTGVATAGAGAALGPVLRHTASAAPPRGAVDDETMRAVYEEVKTPFKYGMVLPPEPGTMVDSPSVFRSGDTWYMVYIVFDGTGYETRLAVSTDLLDWQPSATLLPRRADRWDATQAAGYIALQNTAWGGPATLHRYDKRYWMSYLGGDDEGYEAGDLGIGIASTDDPTAGEQWDRPDAPVLSPDDPDARAWESSKLFKSNVVHDPQRRLGAPFVMHYNAKGGGPERIGVAVSEDMRRWRRRFTEPVLAVGTDITGDPQVVRMGELWVMFFFVANGFTPTGVYDSFACSYDLRHWTPWDGEVLLTATESFDSTYAHKPWVVKHGGIVHHFYCAVGDQGRGIAVATSRDLRATAEPVTVSASYTFVRDDVAQAVDGVVSYSDAPRNRWTAYQSPNAADWLEVRLPGRRAVSGVRLHVYDDGGGVQPPARCEVEYLRGKTWQPTARHVRTPATPGAGINDIGFDPVNTDAIRLWFHHRPGSYSGVTEVEVV
jgi:predicted GH43/DUF377 family glycosyl hydrolase